MTFLQSVIELQSAQQYDNTPEPTPRAPEEVISLLAREAPIGEYSVDAF